MNKLIIIGNLTRDPELRTTPSGIPVCNFTVAVNRRRESNGHPVADYFRVTTWRAQAESCGRYLAKGRKVCCVGPVSISSYESGGRTYSSLELNAEEVEFLSPGRQQEQAAPEPEPAPELTPEGFIPVDPGEDVPF